MAQPYEFVSSFRVDKNVVRQYGVSGTVYKYPGSYNHLKVTFTAHGLDYATAWGLAALVQAAVSSGGNAQIVDALGRTFTGSLESIDGSRPKLGSQRYQVSCLMWDPTIS